MNAANFHEYLKNPSMLHQISYQELKSLMLQYPYSANLRYLMLIKSIFEGNREHERNLVLASLSSIDRRKLQQLLAEHTPEEGIQDSFSLEEDVLELKDLTTLEEMPGDPKETLREMAAEPPPTLEEAMIQMGETQSDGPIFEDSDDLEFLDSFIEKKKEISGESAEDEEERAVESQPEPLVANDLDDVLEEMDDTFIASTAEVQEELEGELEEIIEDELSIEELFAEVNEEESDLEIESVEEEENENSSFASLPQQLEDIPSITSDENEPNTAADLEDLEDSPAPASWIDRVKKPQKGFIIDDLSELPPAEKKGKKKKGNTYKTKETAKEVASKSILEDEEIATETLAGILERQGHYDKAIAMYERLQTKYPEKSNFFAGKIQALKKKK